MPGVNKEDIEVSTIVNELIVSGKRSQNIEENAEDENGFNVLRLDKTNMVSSTVALCYQQKHLWMILPQIIIMRVLELTVPKPIEKEKKTISIS